MVRLKEQAEADQRAPSRVVAAGIKTRRVRAMYSPGQVPQCKQTSSLLRACERPRSAFARRTVAELWRQGRCSDGSPEAADAWRCPDGRAQEFKRHQLIFFERKHRRCWPDGSEGAVAAAAKQISRCQYGRTVEAISPPGDQREMLDQEQVGDTRALANGLGWCAIRMSGA